MPEVQHSFLLPIVVDPEFRPAAFAQPSVSNWRERGIAFGHAPGGEPDEALMACLRRLVREARMRGDAP